jgi:DNA primase large subunit
MVLGKSDLCKYPFTVESVNYVKSLELKTEDFSKPDYEPVIERAILRVKEAFLQPIREIRPSERVIDDEVEILSFPIAVIVTKKFGDSYIQKRYALAEAKKASLSLEADSREKIIEVARNTFGWKISAAEPNQPFEVKIHFTDYVRNATNFHEDKWKLVNRRLTGGEVYVTKSEVARLLQEEIRLHIEKKLESEVKLELPEEFIKRFNVLSEFFAQQKKTITLDEIIKGVDVEAFPPCLTKIYSDLTSGKNIPHMSRFTLTAFLHNIGMDLADIIKLYTSTSDFDEKMTRYQVEHIAGLTGGRTKYKPLNCTTMRTHALCNNPDNLCSRVKNPLVYYKRKMLLLREARGKIQQKQSTSPE